MKSERMNLKKIPRELFDESRRLEEILSVIKKHKIVKNGLTPENLRSIIEDLGPTFIKIGQIMSSRTDVLPKEYCEQLELLRADVKPLSIETIKEEIETELGKKIEEVFASIDEKPLGSASIGQVHSATLLDGRKVVIKVQRPYVADMMMKDFALLSKAATMLKLAPVNNTIDFNMVLHELEEVSKDELDFRIEANNTLEFYENMKDIKYVTCPIIEKELTTQRIMTMSYVKGFSIGNLEKLEENGYDRKEIAVKLVTNYMKQVIDDGLFHADPHQGNILIDEGQIVWLDMGMVGRLSKKEAGIIRTAVNAVSRKDVNLMKSAVLSFGKIKGEINHSKLFSDIDEIMDKYCSSSIEELDIGALLDDIIALATKHGIALPEGFSMLVRGLITIEGVIAKLNVDVNMVELFTSRVVDEFIEGFDLKKELAYNTTSIYDSAKKMLVIPSLAADTMKTLIKGNTKLNVEIEGYEAIIKRFEKIVGDVIVCIITAAILLSSSLICMTDMQPKILEIPAIGFFGFVAAFIMGVYLIIEIFRRKK